MGKGEQKEDNIVRIMNKQKECECQGHSHPKLPVSPSCTQQLLSPKDGRTPVGCP